MKRWLIDTLRRLLLWLDPPAPPPEPNLMRDAARGYMDAQDRLNRRPEHKRRVVLHQLTAKFPYARPRQLALAIELVMQERT